jgi:hypothetical protein
MDWDIVKRFSALVTRYLMIDVGSFLAFNKSKIFLAMRGTATPFKPPNRRWHIPLLATPWRIFWLGGRAQKVVAKKILDMWQAKNGLRSILRWRVTDAEKTFTLSHCIKKLQHFENSFDGKRQCKIVIFRNFETSPRCHSNRKFKIEHVLTEVMVQSTYVPSFISIEAFFIVL